MNDNYKPYIYVLAELANKYHHIVNLNNLFKRFIYMSAIFACLGLATEMGIYIVTKLVFGLINLVRVIEYEPMIDFGKMISALLLGNISVLVFGILYLLALKLEHFSHDLKHCVRQAQRELRANHHGK